ncbi:hypothetical protein BJ165DRAFT_929016 [Panaeolus papilionaceus]|nr:hypothetical protein BJ165DRAFT_929016 [Panaeolus papilionaceus]
MAAPRSHADPEFRSIHTAEVTHCEHCRGAIVDTNESILREIESFAAFNGFEDLISKLISKKLEWLVQQSLQHGITIGRKTQMEEDDEMITQYRQGLLRMRQERDEVKERHQRYQERVVTNTKEIQSIRNALNALSWVDNETALIGSPDDHDLTQESPIHLNDLGETSIQKALELTPVSQNEDEQLTISEALVLHSSDSSLAKEEPAPLHDHEQSDTSDSVVAPENWMAPSNEVDDTVTAQSSATRSENEHLAIEILRSISALDVNTTPTAAVDADELKTERESQSGERGKATTCCRVTGTQGHSH